MDKKMTAQEIDANRSKNTKTVQANAAAARLAIECTWNAGIDPEKIQALVVAAKNAIECRPEHIEGERRSALDYLAGALYSLYITKQDTEK